ncbi:hypothetical protein TSAR_009973 [Trichomalopsis sarcophagae]|uniref:Uncharacterized protein n=1 Tax=Trichomalopsis sarcophagae TaxID=543379 RepID=A0A232EE47_9HYME|nr:hypothetical protein TSAR_009973 [Trichomalopsis sarcophagae]
MILAARSMLLPGILMHSSSSPRLSKSFFFFYLLMKYTVYNNNAICHSASAIIFQFR